MGRLFTFNLLFILLFFLAAKSNLTAQTLTEPFSYSAGDNIGSNSTTTSGGVNNNWTTHSNTSGNSATINVIASSLSYPGLASSTGNKINMPGSNATVPRDVNRPTTIVGTPTVAYYSFLINVVDATQLAGTFSDNGYFISFGNTSGNSVTTLYGRIAIRSANAGANFRLGTQNTTGGTPSYTEFGSDLSFGTTYLIVLKYDFNGASNDISTLWVNPGSLGGSEPTGGVSNSSGTATTPTTFSSIALRNSSATPKADIDELRAGTTWESVTPSGVVATTVSVAAGINAAEPSTDGTFTVTLSSPAPAGGITVSYTLNGSATLSTDYSDELAGSIIIAESNTAGTITLTPSDDLDFEGTETINITLNSATSPYTIAIGTASINLNDNDAPPSVTVTAGVNGAEPSTNGTFTINLSSAAPLGGINVNYTLTGTAALNIDYSDVLSGVINIPQGNSSGTVTLTTNEDPDIEGTETIIITLNNASGGYGIGVPASATINLLDNDNPPIVINEVYGGGGNGGSLYKNDFIELYNNGNTSYSLAGWSVQYGSSTGTTWQVTPLSGSIPAHGYYLIQQAAGTTGGTADLPTPDAIGSIAMAAASGKVILVNTTTAQAGANPTGSSIVDKVGYGTANGFETAPAPLLTNTTSAQRAPIGFDTNNNSTDFTTQSTQTPKNSVTDITAPTISALSPANGSVNAPSAFTAVLTFNENVEKVTGSIVLRKLSDNSLVKTIDVSTSAVTVGGANVSFLIQGLAYNTSYYFEVSNGAFRDLSENPFAGFSGSGTWSFTTSAMPVGIVGNTYNFNTCSSLPDGFEFYSEVGPQLWGCTTFGRDASNLPLGSAPNGVQINGFSATNIPNVDWLISPSFDLTSTTYPLLSFWSRTAFNGEPLQLKVSIDYNGGDPASATWVDINGKFPGETSNAWTLSEYINLSAYKQSNVHFAFVYYSSNDDGARWTLDDILLQNSLTPPPPSLTVGTTGIQFGFTAAGNTSDKTFTFIGNDLTNNITLNATGPFTLSKDGSSFSSSLLYTVAEANNVFKTVYVRFTPPVNKQNFTGNIDIESGSLSADVALAGTSIDPAITLEVVNWNVEWFGSTVFGPTNEAQQEQNIKTILQNLNADIYALAEVVDETRLANVVNQMPGYAYVVGNYGSHTNINESNPSPLGEAQKLAFVYKTSVFSNISTMPLLSQGINSVADLTNPAYDYWASGRFPFMMSADVTLNCITKNVKFVLVHGKANTAPTTPSYNRRKSGADTLHYTLQQNYPNDNIMILGDFNDDLDQSITDGFTVTSWSSFTTDDDNYEALTLPLSLAGKRSTVTHDNVIDHVVVSNEFEPYYMSSTANILTDVTSLVSNYGSSTSDHYPVFTRYIFENTVAPQITNCPTVSPFCVNNTNTYTIPAFTASDDCGDVLTYSYSIAGTTTRSGNTNNASGTFNIGVSTITWTATDDWGNTATCQTTVTINANPTVTIPDAFALSSGTLANTVYIGYSPASSITLAASASGGAPGYNYSWSNSSMSSTTTVSPVVNTTYTVTITDQNNCQASANKQIVVMDIRAGKKLDKVTVCHNQSGTPKTMEVSQAETAIHLSHGDMLGVCGAASIITKGTTEKETPGNGKLAIVAMPNPSAKGFMLNVTGDAGSQLMLRVIDISGRIIETKNVTSNQSTRIGDNYRAGMYLAEVVQGNERKIVKLIKIQ
jgi:hypothetical protein